ncbi:MAG: hypothetical protein R2713_22345 [Ilumatobacteraceae bacterium]
MKDPLETAGLMIMAAHLLPHEALASISDAPRRMMASLPPIRPPPVIWWRYERLR